MIEPLSQGAVPSDAGGTERQEIQLACFRVGAELYALDIMSIREIIRPQKLTSIPKAPRFIEGVINLRGAVIPVADLRKRFDQPRSEENRKNRIIICSVSGRIVGLLVDEVLEVRRCGRQDVAPAPQFLKGPDAEFFLGVARRGDDLVMVLDLGRLLSTDEQIALQKLE
jgi:purine-binding chemotaxis protein CheW